MRSMAIAASKKINFRQLFFYMYPLLLGSGLIVRFYVGDVSMGHIQNSASSLYLPCIFHWLTEFECPGCGITRSLIAMYLWSPQWSFYFHPLGPLVGVATFFYWLSMRFLTVEKSFATVLFFFKKHSFSFLTLTLAWGFLRNF